MLLTVGFIGCLLFSGAYVRLDQLIMEMDRDVEFWQRCSNLLKLLNDVKQRQDILEYKRLHKLLTGQEVEIYTDLVVRGSLLKIMTQTKSNPTVQE